MATDFLEILHVAHVAIDQGGCFEMSRPTTHDYPTRRSTA
jgi:alanine dehydrogenase